MKLDKESVFTDDSNNSFLRSSHTCLRIISHTLSEKCSSSNNNIDNYKWLSIIEINSHVILFVRSFRNIIQHLGNEVQDFYFLLVIDEIFQKIV